MIHNKLVFKRFLLMGVIIGMFMFNGCATFRSDINGNFVPGEPKEPGNEKVNVVFIFSHFKHTKGFDAIPKLEREKKIFRDFEHLFAESLNEFSNIGTYDTYTEFSSDVYSPKRRAVKDSLINKNDFVAKVTILRENSFAKYSLGLLFSTISVTTIPISYTWDYTISVDILRPSGETVAGYKRTVKLKRLVQFFAVFLKPFHPENRKIEEIYLESLKNIFKQINSEGVLAK